MKEPASSCGDDFEADEFVRELTASQEDLLVFIRMMCGNYHLATEIRQAVNMVLWRKREAYQLGTNFRGWAYRIAQFEVKSHLRKLKRDHMIFLNQEVIELIHSEGPEFIDELPERRAALASCLENLTPKDAELIHHRYWRGQPLDHLASSTGRSVGTLKARLFQLRSQLRRCVQLQLSQTKA